ncbi:MAG: hypothetical protein WEC33_01625, partial [Dehalococcoidia bacterium]
QLYAAGTLVDGSGMRVPFLSMERIHGVAIHRYCRKKRLGIRERLELFLKVADAVEYGRELIPLLRAGQASSMVAVSPQDSSRSR